MGDKIEEGKKTAKRSASSVVPGSDGGSRADDDAMRRQGPSAFRCLVKAAAGGGEAAV